MRQNLFSNTPECAPRQDTTSLATASKTQSATSNKEITTFA